MQIFESAHLHFKRHDFEYHLHSEEHREDHIQHVRQMGHMVWLVTVLWVKKKKKKKSPDHE